MFARHVSSVFEDNKTPYFGAAISNDGGGSLHLNSCTFKNNVAPLVPPSPPCTPTATHPLSPQRLECLPPSLPRTAAIAPTYTRNAIAAHVFVSHACCSVINTRVRLLLASLSPLLCFTGCAAGGDRGAPVRGQQHLQRGLLLQHTARRHVRRTTRPRCSSQEIELLSVGSQPMVLQYYETVLQSPLVYGTHQKVKAEQRQTSLAEAVARDLRLPPRQTCLFGPASLLEFLAPSRAAGPA